ncbi:MULTISPECIES: hypothetical protein [Mycolicibacterium]|uniref:hypothetical protein n=1 Tax=Mycolicibacterium TaxID=1866885 RepID=UPI001CDC05E6|nr:MULTISPECIES: hypothetical protein [Mycolicibacterium]MCC9181132.1 hypothetical protein [Mycolicibacterium mageritense]UBV14838.1 hypothetical protein H8Z57_29790 [Mycolicibacterium fortuitum]
MIRLEAGDSLVWVEHKGRRYPVAFDTTWSAKEWMRLHNCHWTFEPGDVLSFPHDFGQAVVEVRVKAPRLWSPWEETIARHFPAYPVEYGLVSVSFLVRQPCPTCGTDALHDAEMADHKGEEGALQRLAKRYVLRTCITCDDSWEQESM